MHFVEVQPHDRPPNKARQVFLDEATATVNVKKDTKHRSVSARFNAQQDCYAEVHLLIDGGCW